MSPEIVEHGKEGERAPGDFKGGARKNVHLTENSGGPPVPRKGGIEMLSYQSDHLPDFDSSGTKIVFAMIVFSIVVFFAGLFVGYFRDTFQSPPGDEHSVPVARTY